MRYVQVFLLCLLPAALFAMTPADILPAAHLLSARPDEGPVANAAFYPGADAKPAAPFAGTLLIKQSELQTRPMLKAPLQQGRDARLFPGVTLEFFTLDDELVPVQLGEMVREPKTPRSSSYWRLIPQVGRVWKEPADGGWSRAAFPLMLVSDLENQAQQGLASFLYRDGRVSALTFQFVQQSGPYLLQHFVAWGRAGVELKPAGTAGLDARRRAARAELAERLPAKPWSELTRASPAGALEGFGGPLYPKWRVEAALLKDGTLYYQDSQTPFGPYPYPLEMRFGVRSVTKSVGAPLALLHLAQLYGPWVLTLKIGDYVQGLDPKWRRVRFIDAADMATGFGGLGTLKTQPNDIMDGYLLGNYDAWYLAPSRDEKIKRINEDLKPYPWEPDTVVRYRDHDFFLLGMALDAFLKSERGPSADVWEMLKSEVFAPIGIRHAPALRTEEAGGRDGYILFNAGYYPSLDDLAKIAQLYQDLGAHNGVQLLNRELTSQLLAAEGALRKDGDASVHRATPAESPGALFYHLGFHFAPFETKDKRQLLLPTMEGAGENEVALYPNGMVSLIMANALQVPDGEKAKSDAGPETARAVERLKAFEPKRSLP
ncbi:MAG TPA: hypothetical protein VGI93_04410 [Steroidobacteraceae bacterium]|jgi:hypothetical protein